MILSRLMEWSATVRNRDFTGRSFLGKLYRLFLFSLMDRGLKLFYRLHFSVKEKNLAPFRLSDYQLLKLVRAGTPTPYLCRRWVQSIPLHHHSSRYTDILAAIHAIKFRTKTDQWIFPETALLAPELDCKGFATLFSSVLNAIGILNELWIGLPSDGRNGHAWVVLETEDGRIAVDQFNGNGTDEALFHLHHPYSMTLKI